MSIQYNIRAEKIGQPCKLSVDFWFALARKNHRLKRWNKKSLEKAVQKTPPSGKIKVGLATTLPKGEDVMNDIHSLSHSKWNCKYHIVFATEIKFLQKKNKIMSS